MKKFSAVVETGSCSRDGLRWETRTDCGHAHRTLEAAQSCLDKQQMWRCNHGRKARARCRPCGGYAEAQSTSALWYNGTIHESGGRRA